MSVQPRTLESFVEGRWARGDGDAAVLRHAATGAPVARISSAGVDFAGALAFARDVGGPNLRALSFHGRAAMLKALGQHLMARKEEFYAEASPPARRGPTAGSTSRAASSRCWRSPPRHGGSCRTPAC